MLNNTQNNHKNVTEEIHGAVNTEVLGKTYFFVYLVCVCVHEGVCMCMCVCLHVCRCMWLCVSLWRSDNDIKSLSLLLSRSFSETASLIEPESCCFG